MTPEHAVECLQKLHDMTDTERARVCAEDTIIDLLNYFGAEEVGRVWTQEVPAWENCSWVTKKQPVER